MSNSQEPIITLTGEELKIHKIMRKKIVFGTDILGILLNKNLIKSDNIFVNKEILKYRIFQTWRELAYFIGYTRVDNRLKDDEVKLMLQRQIKIWVSQDKTKLTTKDQILFGISQKFDDSICSFLCNYDDVSCLTTDFMEDYIMFYDIDKKQYESREDFQNKNGKRGMSEQNYRKNLMDRIYKSISLNEGEKQDINFYTRAHSLIKEENNLSSEITDIKDEDMRFKRLEFEEIFKYYKPFGPKKTSENGGIQKKYVIIWPSEIHRMMKQFQELINRCKKEIFKENAIPIIMEAIKTEIMNLGFGIDKANKVAEIIKETINTNEKEMSKEKIISEVKLKLAEILIKSLDKSIVINILKNVETKIKEVPEDKFFFYGTFGIVNRKNNYKDPSYLINFEKMKKMGYRYIGYIFIHGTDNFQFSHYIAIYIDIKENNIYYYDPHNDPILEFYKRFIIYLFLHNGIAYGNVKLDYETNKNIAHQKIEGNCGTFASMGLFALASGIKFKNYVKLPINAKFIAQINNILFNDRINYVE